MIFQKTLHLTGSKKKKKKKTGLKDFSLDYNPINTSDILDIHRFSMKET